jgi:Ca2+-binding EF-hand superfamily protein
MRDAIAQNKIIEEKRIALSLRFDFNIRELYRVLDPQNLGSLTHNHFTKFMKSIGNNFPLKPTKVPQSLETN